VAEFASRDVEPSIVQIEAIARTGLAFTTSGYERERYEEILRVVARLRTSVEGEQHSDEQVAFEALLAEVGEGVAGYVTPKAAVGAVVIDEARRMLLIQRADSGMWLYPTGWADVGYSPSEVVVKEVWEETGIRVRPVALLGLIDGMRRGFTRLPMYSSIFLCRPVGGVLRPHPLEVRDARWFARSELPPNVAQLMSLPWLARVFAEEDPCWRAYFDPPRDDRDPSRG
jgi:ADP-ribose pyrophosphatase YjhB (NUDIX family)